MRLSTNNTMYGNPVMASGLKFSARKAPGSASERVAPSRDSVGFSSLLTRLQPGNIDTGIQQALSFTKAQSPELVQKTLVVWQQHPQFDQLLSTLIDAEKNPEEFGLNSPGILHGLDEALSSFLRSNLNRLCPGALQAMALKTDPCGEVNYIGICTQEFIRRNDKAGLYTVLEKLSEQDAQRQTSRLKSVCEALSANIQNPRTLWQWSQLVEPFSAKSASGGIEAFDTEMKGCKQTDRALDKYIERLNIPEDQLNTLAGKNLCLVGGGYSPIKKGLLARNLNSHVLNIDPLCREASSDNEDHKLALNYYHPSIPDHFKAHPPDEIWALNSLPQYAMSPQEALRFYTISLMALSHGGTLRVSPVADFKDNLSESMYLGRPIVSETSQKVLEILQKNKKLFQVERYEVKHRGFNGTVLMPGATIRVTGRPDKVEAFLTRKLPKLVRKSIPEVTE